VKKRRDGVPESNFSGSGSFVVCSFNCWNKQQCQTSKFKLWKVKRRLGWSVALTQVEFSAFFCKTRSFALKILILQSKEHVIT